LDRAQPLGNFKEVPTKAFQPREWNALFGGVGPWFSKNFKDHPELIKKENNKEWFTGKKGILKGPIWEIK